MHYNSSPDATFPPVSVDDVFFLRNELVVVAVLLMLDGICMTWVLNGSVDHWVEDAILVALYALYFYFSAFLPVAHSFRKSA